MKVYLTTLGCKLNESELEAWTRKFTNDGYEIVDDPRKADLCVVNTCTVTHVAARKSRQLARQVARANPNARLVVTGCFADISPDEAKTLPNVALVVPNRDKDRLVALAGDLLGDVRFQTTETGCRLPEAASGELQSVVRSELGRTTSASTDNSPSKMASQQSPDNRLWSADGGKPQTAGHGSQLAIPNSLLRTRAFVKIQDGCNMSCTYCIIPLARGKERSRAVSEVVDEVRALANAGYKEIILTGVQISVYCENGINHKFALRDLVAALLAETDVPRLRLTSIAPWDLDEALLDLFGDARLCRHLHLSLQSGSDPVLHRMRRPYTTAQFARAVEFARARIPGVGITTDVIVGFPGESQAEFEQSLEFVQAMKFSRVHVFPYSARAGTVAALLPLHVTDADKESRVKQMQAVGDASAQAFAQQVVGRTVEVLWESREQAENLSLQSATLAPHPFGSAEVRNSQFVWSGYSDNYIRVTALSDRDMYNQITQVRVVDVLKDGVLATGLDL